MNKRSRQEANLEELQKSTTQSVNTQLLVVHTIDMEHYKRVSKIKTMLKKTFKESRLLFATSLNKSNEAQMEVVYMYAKYCELWKINKSV